MIENVRLASLAPLKMKSEVTCWENRPFTTMWPENIPQKKRDITRTIKKKQKRARTAFSTDQLRALEKVYSSHKYIDSEKRADLSNTLKIGDKCIKIWFQNRRMKEKRESSESSNDSSSESVSIESPSVSSSPPLPITIEQPITEHTNNFSHYLDQNYQLPTYFNTNQIQSGYGGVQPAYGMYFYNENNVYPTQYYPYDVNYSNGEGNGYVHYGSEVNTCWTANQYPYYTTI